MTQLGSDEVRAKVTKVLGVSLALEPEEIAPEARLVQDLGMDSLDFLDVLFSLEREFDVPIRDPALNRVLRPDKSELIRNSEYLDDEEIAGLVPLLPALADAAARQPVRRQELFAYLTVESLTRVVERKLAGSP